jgi:energy-coupling factor transport system ATP-binding protein
VLHEAENHGETLRVFQAGQTGQGARTSVGKEQTLALELRQVSATYQGSGEAAIHCFDLAVPRGQVVVLCGESGCGKTTVTRVINGLFPRFYEGTLFGTLRLNGQDVASMPMYERAALVGSVFQDPRSQFYTTTTTDEVAFGAENLAVGTPTVNERVSARFREAGLGHLRDRDIFHLSSGEKQRIAIASVQAMEPEIYVLDEPSANLDMVGIRELTKLITGLKERGKTVIISEHRLYYLTELLDRMIVMRDGVIVLDLMGGEGETLDRTRQREYGLRCLTVEEMPFVPAPAAPAGDDALVAVSGGDGSDALVAPAPALATLFAAPAPRPSLRLDKLWVGYRGTPLLRDVSLSFNPGEVIGIVGRNGVGKTAFARTVCGLERQLAGDLYLNGHKQGRRARRRAICGLVMQDADYQLFAESVLDELVIGLKDTVAIRQYSRELLEKLGLNDVATRHPLSLSGGQKQRLSIGACIAQGKDILFMDEPTSGLDGRNVERLCVLLRDLATRGKTIFFISHDYEFLISSCARILSFGGADDIRDFALTQSTCSKLYGILQEKEGTVWKKGKRGERIERIEQAKRDEQNERSKQSKQSERSERDLVIC